MLLLERFNQCSRNEAVAILWPCIAVERWTSQIIAGRPYPTLDALLSVARQAAPSFTEDEIASALSKHPRIGDRPTGESAEAGHSRTEQAGITLTDSIVDALAAGNRAYEAKFDRVFLIRAAGRSAEEILEALNQRLENTREQESAAIEAQLREIADIRLRGEISA